MYVKIIVVDLGDRREYYADHLDRELTIYLGPDEQRAAARMFEIFGVHSRDLCDGIAVRVPDVVGEQAFRDYGVRPFPLDSSKII